MAPLAPSWLRLCLQLYLTETGVDLASKVSGGDFSNIW